MSLPRSPPQGYLAPLQQSMSDEGVEGINSEGAGGTRNVSSPEINATKLVKLPQPFWREMPAHWFQIAEAAFALNKITGDDTKYRYVLTNLDPSIILFITDIMSNPPAQGKYEALKKRIIESFDESQESKLRKLLRGQEMNDKKPSHLLQHLRNLAGGQCTDNVVRSLFLEQLPESARGILSISQVNDLNQLAIQADRIIDIMKPQIAEMHKETPKINSVDRSVETQLQELTKMVHKLSVEVSRDRTRQRSRSRHFQHKSKSRERESVVSNRTDNNNYCYYHNKFGNKSFKCRQPCAWDKKTQEN
ncbi:uncharacterized protein LOC109861954 [Pseudomyrmex gracilis]|uniref:uncharacterized protein LOC109861954 n=1 Tax=Pseudomyrmex gracilis TaxID=219809 RepID=UPI00099583F7|nr:uncharacterized protein LOC109861954 [Pseudomyrmex gracilis]